MSTHTNDPPNPNAVPNRTILFLEALSVFAVALVLGAVVFHSSGLTASSHGGIYLFAMLIGLSAFMLSVALLLEQLKDQAAPTP